MKDDEGEDDDDNEEGDDGTVRRKPGGVGAVRVLERSRTGGDGGREAWGEERRAGGGREKGGCVGREQGRTGQRRDDEIPKWFF